MLQNALVRELNSGVLVPSPNYPDEQLAISKDHAPFYQGLPVQDLVSLNCMPPAWARAAILIRLNSLISGCSGVRALVVERLVDLLRLDIVPRIPIHGSISASGDLAPLSYVAGTIQGKANITCTVGALQGSSKVLSASEALAEAGVHSERFQAKEGLAITNGTAISSAVGALALHEVHGLVVMSEVLTAMSVEALLGNDESFDPFFAKVRPHRGQVDASRCISSLLEGSKLANTHSGRGVATLKQDRYSIRTASQWLSPVLEDIQLAHEQVLVECNSVTDNPLVDHSSGPQDRYLHGGNFQARVVTSAMEKIRQSLQSIGRMLFTQCTEIINPATSQGLPPNLVGDDPSESHMFKSLDIQTAALLSELGFLANPVGSHVQTAEMGNQALNSLALISARYTLDAADILSKLAAAHLIVACQALDLRAMERKFLSRVKVEVISFANEWQRLVEASQSTNAEASPIEPFKLEQLGDTLYADLPRLLGETSLMDSKVRFRFIAESLQQHCFTHMKENPHSYPKDIMGSLFLIPNILEQWTESVSQKLGAIWRDTRSEYLASPDPSMYLGQGSRRMYPFVRKTLQIPFMNNEVLSGCSSVHVEDKEDHQFNASTSEISEEPKAKRRKVDLDIYEDHSPPTIGHYMTRVYTAIRNGALIDETVKCLQSAIA